MEKKNSDVGSFDTYEDDSQLDLISIENNSTNGNLPFLIPNIKDTFFKAINEFKNFLHFDKNKNVNEIDDDEQVIQRKNSKKKLNEFNPQKDHKEVIGILNREQDEVYFNEKDDPTDSKGLVSLFWKRNENSKFQKVDPKEKDPPTYDEIAAPTFLDSIVHPKINIRSLDISNSNQVRIRKEQIEKDFYSFQYLDKEKSSELHYNNTEAMVTLFGKFLNYIELSSWYLLQDETELFTEKEIKFLNAVGKEKYKKERKAKRERNFQLAKLVRKELLNYPILGKEYIILRSDLINQMDFLMDLIEQLNWYEIYDDEKYHKVPLNKLF